MTETTGKIVVAGGNGFLGRHLSAALVREGRRVIALVRPGREGEVVRHPDVRAVAWDGRALGDWGQHLDGAEAVVNLVGRSVDCIKNDANVRQIFDSRTDSVRVLGEACRAVASPPKVWLQSGTAHIIGDPEPPGTVCDDSTEPPDHGLAPDVGRAWEAAFHEAKLPEQRGVMLRISFVLGPDGGALQRLVPLAKWFLGGTVGSGHQWMSWLHIEDLNRLWLAALTDASYEGIYMTTAPNPVTNREFMRELRRACGRPWSPPAPSLGVKLVAPLLMKTDPELALLGRRIVPSRLLETTDFEFRWPELGPALADVVGRWGQRAAV